ncbi:MAG: phosphate ABC transporter substrate-binding/OmpA family protein [Reichenbachiella sp.]|uniref:phosphate ABC transporter substrate-binding/OmpA family protein n=1 Tax=Reichenbachiella sp. TaxID=2184521 RepID=UPI003264E9C2
MSKLKGPFILFLVITLLVIAGYYGKEILFNQQIADTSDASGSTTTFRWAGDGYLGYSFLETLEMKKQLARNEMALKFTDDGGDYKSRLEKFADKEYDFIVLPVNSYLEHGGEHKYPGVIVAAIAESKGADAIVGFDDVLPSNKINELNNSDLRIYYTPASPSSFLLDLTITDFALDELSNDQAWRREVNGSEEVFAMAEKAVKDRSKGDAFVMWEPEVSKAINELGLKKLWGSDQFSGYIIDVFVFRREVVSKSPEKIKAFLKTYFRVLNYYNSRDEEMVKEFSRITGLKKNVVSGMIENIDWYNLNENCTQMFDIPLELGFPSRDGMINSIYACSDIMIQTGRMQEDIEDPYQLINTNFLEDLNNSNIKSIGENGNSDDQQFGSLTPSQWENLQEIGTMRVEPITFQSGTSHLDYQGEEIVDKVANMLVNNYPEYRIAIRGHTGRGDQKANMTLSQKRAEVVRQRLIAVHGIDENRMNPQGLGASSPPKKKSGENSRAYRLRWARVEFALLSDDNI